MTCKDLKGDRGMDGEDVVYTHTHTYTVEYYSAMKMKSCHLQQHRWI